MRERREGGGGLLEVAGSSGGVGRAGGRRGNTEIGGCAVEGFASRFRPEGTISNETKREQGRDLDPAIFQLLPSV